MRKKCGTVLAASLLLSGANPKILCSLGPGAASYQASSDQRPSSDTMQLASRVNGAVKAICVSNCPGVMVLRNPTAANAMLISDGDHAKLVYAPPFFASVHDAQGDAGIFGIIAHEFGHALEDTLGARWIQADWSAEVRADAWTGCALAKSDLNAGETQAALAALEKYPSPAHPAWNVRLAAIRAGFAGCGGNPSKLKLERKP